MTLFNSLLPLLFAGVSPGSEADASGVARVLLRGEQVLVQASFSGQADVRLLQLQPHEDALGGKRLKPDWQWADGIATARLSRLDGGVDKAFSRFQLIDAPSGRPLGQSD